MSVKQAQRKLGFTLLELMVAVVVLLVVMIAVGRIFSTVVNLSAKGIAIGETLQQATAIEQQFREDIMKISNDGFFAIRHVAVPNNISREYVLIDEAQAPDAILRFDQLVFLRLGAINPMGLYRADFAAQAVASMVHYGHGVSFSLPTAYHVDPGNITYSNDPELLIANSAQDQVITPWFQGAVDYKQREYTGGQDTNMLIKIPETGGTTNATQQQAGRWMLCRQAIALCDDDQNDREEEQKKRYGENGISTHTIFPRDPHIQDGGDPNNDPDIFPHIMHGRVDIAATNLGDIRNSILHKVEIDDGTQGRSWSLSNASEIDQQELIASLLQWPRVEAYPTAPYRHEQMLMMSGLAQGCVSFQIEWMYDEGVGAAVNKYGAEFEGYKFTRTEPQPWWGGSFWSDEDGDGIEEITFNTLEKFHEIADQNVTDDIVAPQSVGSIFPPWNFMERTFNIGEGPEDSLIPVLDELGVEEYWTIFGYNSTEPFAANNVDFLNGSFSTESFDRKYTPRPSALRITLRLIDRDGKLGAGWLYQFIVDLPEVNG